MLESVVLLLLMLGAETLFFGDGYFATLDLHPFWLVILLAAMQHGVFVGVATAGVAAALMDWPVRTAGVALSAHYVEAAILPLQWLIAALCIGFVRQMQVRAARRLLAENLRLAEMNEVLSSEVKRLGATIRRMELEAVTRPGEEHLSSPLEDDDLAWQSPPPARKPAPEIDALRGARPADLSKRFAAAATVEVGRPCTILLPDDDGRFCALDGTDRIPGLSLPLDPGSRILASAMEADGAVVQPASSSGLTAKGTLTAIALQGEADDSCAALIVALGHDAADAVTLLPALETLACATYDAIAAHGTPVAGHQDGGRAKDE